jgi:hypothetical protein
LSFAKRGVDGIRGLVEKPKGRGCGKRCNRVLPGLAQWAHSRDAGFVMQFDGITVEQHGALAL